MRDEALKGTETILCTSGPEERSVVALHGQRVAQQQVAHAHEETLDATELVELVCFPEHILYPCSAHRRLTACYQQGSHHLGLWDAAELNDSGMQPILAQDSTLLEVVFVVDHARADEDLLNQIKKLLDRFTPRCGSHQEFPSLTVRRRR